MTTHYRVTLTIHTLEPGSHISRETISRRVFAEYVLPAADCEELRPDWGVYHPVATARAAERRLRDMGAMPTLTRDEECYIGIVDCA